MDQTYLDLVDAANTARKNSYSPYSKFRVGAALLGESGQIYLGTNVENASFGLSNCAERTAIFAAVTAGERTFTAIAVCADGSDPTPPCGACRQVLLEFGPEMVVLTAGDQGSAGSINEFTVNDLLPDAFHTYLNDGKEGAK